MRLPRKGAPVEQGLFWLFKRAIDRALLKGRCINIDVEVDVDIEVYWLFKRGFKVSSGTVGQWYRSSYGTNFDNSETASPVEGTELWAPVWWVKMALKDSEPRGPS